MATVRLKPGHVQPVWAGHPWVYAQAIDRVEGNPTGGDEVTVIDPRGNLLGRGFFSPGSAIPVRILVRDAKTRLDAAFFRERIERASPCDGRWGCHGCGASSRGRHHRIPARTRRGGRLPGLIVDRFGDAVVVQLLTVGMKMREELSSTRSSRSA